ncbi:hypothetical protein [Geobacter sp.]|uniref:hypothetical protein n=1 Tax=Geobacter sp. TaxID=46610 RepID=UPI0027BA7A16|nr:hypothetical protein [Geobacter sp.]
MRAKRIQEITTFIILLSLVGCASRANNISAIYVPPLKYQNHNCEQIRQKLDSVCEKVNILSSIQNADANSDPVALASGVISLWFPVMFMSGGSHEKDIAQLKGEIIALEQSAIEKQCSEVLTFIQNQREFAMSLQESKIELLPDEK